MVITSDKDFGEMVVHQGRESTGVLLLRLRSNTVAKRTARLASVWDEVAATLSTSVTVVSDRRVRIRPIRAFD